MKMQMIIENQLADIAKELSKEIRRFGESELKDLVENPRETINLIQKGSTSKQLILTDGAWIERFMQQWILLDENTKDKILDEVSDEVTKKIESLQQKNQGNKGTKNSTEDIFKQDLVLLEGIGGFLSKLAKWTLLIIKLLLTINGGSRRYGQNAANADDLRIFNPFAVFRLTKRLHDTSVVAFNNQQVQIQPQQTQQLP
jgi:hypothetical protein